MRSIQILCAVLALAVAAPASAIVFGSVKGVVHDPQHRPVPGASVTLKARNADLTQTTTSGPDGEFEFTAVPIGEYTVTVSLSGFDTAEEAVTVVSSGGPVLHVQLQLAQLEQSVTVTAPEAPAVETMTPTTVVNGTEIQATPGADRSNSLAAITAFVPGAYVTHDQLHVRGGHQVTWLVDGVPVPNTNIASNVGPQFDPKDIDFLEVQRGSYGAQYGDRTYAIFNVVPRSGFERDREAEVVASAGSFGQTNDQISLGDHTERFAYYVSANGNRSSRGLDTPVAVATHDEQHGFGGFGSLIFNADPNNQLRLVASARGDRYQVPTAPDEQMAGIADTERESDMFVNLTWARTLATGRLLTVSPFFHQNTANFDGGASDPVSATDHHTSRYAGLQTTLNADLSRHTIQVGFYGFRQDDDQSLAIVFNDGSAANVAVSQQPGGHIEAVFAEDRFAATDWLTLTAGVRQTHFSGGVVENATSPRLGATVQIPGTEVSLRGFYGRFYQAPPLITASGPLLALLNSQALGLIPLHGERDEEYQVGVALPVRGWTLDVDRFHTRATNFFDHNPIGNSNVFFPVTIEGALIRGWEATVRSPRAWKTVQVHTAYSYQHADGRGAITGGLTDFEPPEAGYFPLDHDQRHTFSGGVSATLPRAYFGSAELSYGSGFPDDETGTYLDGHTTLDLTGGRAWGTRLSVSVTVLNVTNVRRLVDNSLTFGGTHYNRPREVYAQVRYRFKY